MQITYGIDVSVYQGIIDWNIVKRAGIKFAYIRATCGLLEDVNYKRNAEGANLAGIENAPYGVFYFTIDPIAQAEKLCKTVEPYPHTILPAVDVEIKHYIGKTIALQKLMSYLNFVDLVHKGKSHIYVNKYFYQSYLSAGIYNPASPPYELEMMLHPLWTPIYITGYPLQFYPWVGWDVHQWTDQGRIPGITSKVDLNRTFLTPEELRLRGRS